MKHNDFDLAKNALEHSQIIAFPTETVMGLGVFYDDFKAYQFLNTVKMRPEDKPYTLMLSDPSEIEKYAIVDERAKKIISAFVPGPVTVLLRSKENVPSYVTHGTGVIGVRVPDFEVVRNLIRFVKKPLLVPSANKSGQKPCLTYQEVINVFGHDVSYVLKENALGQAPSTIIDLTSKDVKILREGPISLRDIERIL